MKLFPELPLTRMLQAYLYYIGEQNLDDAEEEQDGIPFNDEEEDPYEVILVCELILAYR